MYQFVERAIRGGVSMISHRYAEATDTRSLIYLDANSLYALAMRQPLPVSDFKCVDAADVDVASIPDDGEHGYFFEVDLEYPKELHQLHNDYPLAPERMQVTRSTRS